jgi:hypothetical protein
MTCQKMGSLYHQEVTERLELLRHLKNLRTEYRIFCYQKILCVESKKDSLGRIFCYQKILFHSLGHISLVSCDNFEPNHRLG